MPFGEAFRGAAKQMLAADRKRYNQEVAMKITALFSLMMLLPVLATAGTVNDARALEAWPP